MPAGLARGASAVLPLPLRRSIQMDVVAEASLKGLMELDVLTLDGPSRAWPRRVGEVEKVTEITL